MEVETVVDDDETVVENDDDSYGHKAPEWGDDSSTSSEDTDDDAVAVVVDDVDDDDSLAPATAVQAPALATPSPAVRRARKPKAKSSAPRRTSSIAHDDWTSNRCILLHVDIESGGEGCGIVQLSCVAHDSNRNKLGEFDRYVKPDEHALWDSVSMSIHNIRPSQERIKRASPITEVWPEFVEWCESQIPENKVGIFVAWGGKSCDCKWMFKITEDIYPGLLSMPGRCKYFMDPMSIIKQQPACELNINKSNLLGYGCAEVWCFVTGNDRLPDAHSSIVDARAQMEIVTDDRFWKYRDRPDSLVTLESVWEAKRKSRQAAVEELHRDIPVGWSPNVPKNARLGTESLYNSGDGGPPYGPSAEILRACESRDLADVFCFFYNQPILEEIARETNRYATEDWVKPRNPAARDLNDEDESDDELDDDHHNESVPSQNYQMLVPCDPTDPQARHRHNNGKDKSKWKWRLVTVGALLVYFGIILIRGAIRLRTADLFWSTTDNTNNPTIQNAMVRDAFHLIRRNLHFVNNATLPKKGSQNYNPLNKILKLLNKVTARLQRGWTLGWKICIDESMIKYMGSFVPFVQYMPAKPIKHGIKVFALCCAFTGYLYSFEVYTGKEELVDGSAQAVVMRLLHSANIAATGQYRILYTDNFYTSLALMTQLYIVFKMYMVGTFRLTKKKSRTADDFAFAKLSNKALKNVPRGWNRVAFRNVSKNRGNNVMFTVQATIWRDKKVVGFLHNFLVEQPTGEHTVLRWSPHLNRKREIQSPTITSDYVAHFNGVDHNDRDGADWTVSFQGDRWYMRVFYWQFDSVIFSIYLVVKFVAQNSDKDDPWHKYLDRHSGRYKFQMDLAHALISKGIKMDWPEYKDDNPDKKTRPPYMRQQDWIPCGCGRCFFCVNNITHGVAHEEQIGRKRKSGDISMKSHPDEATDMFNKTDPGKKASTHYCDVCIHSKRVLHPGMKLKEIKAMKDVHSTTKGCDVCKMFVCSHCWPSFTHTTSDYRH